MCDKCNPQRPGDLGAAILFNGNRRRGRHSPRRIHHRGVLLIHQGSSSPRS